ncbi:MAG TPA: hypothetical protein VLB86_13650 [Gaiellaceae bacterium]|nr:hypothetical protein [Gaiellaceae bacterium]
MTRREDGADTLVPRPREEPRVHRLRFALAYLALAVLAGAAVGATILLSDSDRHTSGLAWSTWKPDGKDGERPKQIADFVASRYTQPSGSQLVLVFGGPPSIKTADTEVPIRWVAIGADENAEDPEVVATDDALMYVLCGFGENCAIDQGEPSQERYRLLRREALELALYTFKYVGGTDSVIVLLPPSQDTQTQETASTALFFRKGDFDAELDRPLELTLSRPHPPTATQTDPAESLTVDRLTRPRLFTYEYRQAPEGSAVMLLAPITLSAGQ